MRRYLPRAYLCLVAILILSACATSGNPDKLKPTVIEGSPGTLNILRYDVKPYLLKARISIDGQEVGRLKNGDYIEFPVLPGRRLVKLHFNPLAFMGTKTRILNVSPGQAYHLQLDSQFSINTVPGAGLQGEWDMFFAPAQAKSANFCCDPVAINSDYDIVRDIVPE